MIQFAIMFHICYITGSKNYLNPFLKPPTQQLPLMSNGWKKFHKKYFSTICTTNWLMISIISLDRMFWKNSEVCLGIRTQDLHLNIASSKSVSLCSILSDNFHWHETHSTPAYFGKNISCKSLCKKCWWLQISKNFFIEKLQKDNSWIISLYPLKNIIVKKKD